MDIEGKRLILGVYISRESRERILKRVEQWLDSNEFFHIVTPNPEFLCEASRNREFQRILNKADLALPDGFGIVLASVLTRGEKIRKRYSGVDFIGDLAQICAKKKKTMLLVGGIHHVAFRAAKALKEKYPGLRAVSLPDPGIIAPDGIPSDDLLGRINEIKPSVLLMGLGSPKQDLWIEKAKSKLSKPLIAMGCGGAFDFIAGDVPRAPLVMRKLGFEWAFRFIHNPARVKRILRATILFLYKLFFHKQ